jgi:drug/metabolite transporter (DMT)-like permease
MTLTVPARLSAGAGRPWAPAAAAAATLVLWASAFVVIRHLGHAIAPGPLSLGRLLVASVVVGILVLRRGGARWPKGREWPLLLAGGAFWFGVYNLALNESERRIDAGTAALVIQIGTLIVALLAALFFGERLHRWLLIGMTIGFAGVVVIGRASADSAQGDLLGVLLAVLCAAAYAVGVLTQKSLVRTLPPLQVTWLSCMVGAVVCLPWAGDLVRVVGSSPTSDLLWIVYLGMAPTALAFTLWAYALSRSDAGKLSLTTFLVPAIATLLAWLLLDEVPPPLAFLCGALCVGGVLLTRRKPKED